jgi:hypothetical protein
MIDAFEWLLFELEALQLEAALLPYASEADDNREKLLSLRMNAESGAGVVNGDGKGDDDSSSVAGPLIVNGALKVGPFPKLFPLRMEGCGCSVLLWLLWLPRVWWLPILLLLWLLLRVRR